jgi:putative tryptophan/tyrosine transport system substrate-binding protein
MKKAAVPSILVAVVQLAVGVIAEAQQPKSIPLVGVLVAGSPSSMATRINAFQQRLRELGYTEGRNIVVNIIMHQATMIVWLHS